MARGYSVLANGGYKVDPYLIDLVQDGSGKDVFRANPPVACDTCTTDMIAAAESAAGPATDSPPASKLSPRVVDPRVAWMVDDVLREVTIRGTAAQARALGRTDIAGKTGTTNDETDAWFNGFTPELVAVTWVGFDQPTPLGRGEVGGKAALPMWMDFMGAALKDHPDMPRARPEGMVTVRIDRSTGYLASGGDAGAINEIVPEDRVPKNEGADEAPRGVEDLF
jgi:penicillin-binding protein 1A